MQHHWFEQLLEPAKEPTTGGGDIRSGQSELAVRGAVLLGFGILAALLIGSIPGILFGTRLAGVAPDWLLRPLLAVTLCYAAYALLSK